MSRVGWLGQRVTVRAMTTAQRRVQLLVEVTPDAIDVVSGFYLGNEAELTADERRVLTEDDAVLTAVAEATEGDEP